MQYEKMTLEGFREMSTSYQAQYTWGHGECIATLPGQDDAYLLFQVESFYVEIQYNNEGNKIECLNALNDLASLDRYLNKIYIARLYL